MSLKDRIKLNKERKIQAYRDSLAAETGIYFSPELSSNDSSFPFLKYIVNALILFGASFGSLDCLVSAFELEVTIIPLLMTCVIGSLVLSFMYVSRRAKISVYLLTLVGVIAVAFGGFSVINSGVSAIRNHILSYIDMNVDLPFLREFNLYYSDEYTAMSLALCVLAVTLLILINILVSEKMSFRGLFMLTFPIVQFGMYFNFASSKFAMLCVVSSWILSVAINFTNGYDGLTRKMVSKASVKKHRHRYGFVTDSKNVANISMVWLSFILVVTGLVFTIMPNEGFELSLPTDSIKTSTERVVKNFLSYGMSSMWSLDNKGTEPGSLANLSHITFDGRTDLKITMVRTGPNRVYFRNYVGYDYNSSSLKWETNQNEKDYGDEYNFTAELLKSDFDSDRTVSKTMQKIGVKVVDYTLMEYPLQVPYYALLEGDDYVYRSSGEVTLSDSAETTANDTQYYTTYLLDDEQDDYKFLIERNPELKELEENLREDAYSNALDVPSGNVEAIEKFCQAYDIKATDEDVVSKVITALETDFEYTLEPGKVPYGEDYINYFLLGNQKGYCQHFASAATLIFRYLGIPSRYVEGYAVDSSQFTDALSLYNEDASEWVTSDYHVVGLVSEISVPDYYGHAWVEIYKDGIGWVTVEATTAQAAEGGRSLIADIFGGSNPLTSLQQNMIDSVKNINAENTTIRFIILLTVAVMSLVVAYLVRMAGIVFRRRMSFHTKSIKANINNRWLSLKDVWDFTYNTDKNLSFEELSSEISSKGFMEESGEDFCREFERILFSGEDTDETTEREYKEKFASIRKKIKGDMSLMKKFRYYFVKVMW